MGKRNLRVGEREYIFYLDVKVCWGEKLRGFNILVWQRLPQLVGVCNF